MNKSVVFRYGRLGFKALSLRFGLNPAANPVFSDDAGKQLAYDAVNKLAQKVLLTVILMELSAAIV